MDYANKDSITATQRSYNEALDKLLSICPNIKASANEYNQRIVMPIYWRPVFGYKKENLLRHINIISTKFETLFDFGKPKIIETTYTIWKERWLNVYCAIQFPFSIYGWDYGKTIYPEGYDDKDEPKGKPQYIPPTMSEWNSPRYITLVVYDGVWDKGWGLKDWHLKYDEILNFSNAIDDVKTKAHYMSEISKANTEVEKWEQALSKLQTLIIPKG